ncbi:unnamed protein product [Sphagnum troendelagicum]|jgi:hypothetical protein|uniref:Uncharacterized protein n=1 Tax=Sphagnum jensenii TaxID=128206 RepID=A0ABP1BY30_9BRYO
MPIDIAWKHKLLVAVLGSGGEGGSLLVIKCIACEHGMMIVNTIGGGMWHDNYEHNMLMVSMIVGESMVVNSKCNDGGMVMVSIAIMKVVSTTTVKAWQ